MMGGLDRQDVESMTLSSLVDRLRSIRRVRARYLGGGAAGASPGAQASGDVNDLAAWLTGGR